MFTGGVCSGGHGLSIGSVGGRSDNTVNGVTFSNSEVKSSVNGNYASNGPIAQTETDYWGLQVSALRLVKMIPAPLRV